MNQESTTIMMILVVGLIMLTAVLIRFHSYGRNWWKPRRFMRYEQKHKSQENMQELLHITSEQKHRSSRI